MYLNKPQRKKEYDYSLPGAYFITICTGNRKCVFGFIKNGKMVLNSAGEISAKKFKEIPEHHPSTGIGEFVVMPNHIHGIIFIYETLPLKNVGQWPAIDPALKLIKPQRRFEGIPVIIGSYKAAVMREVKKNCPGYKFEWQTSYYDHIIRNEMGMEKITDYIKMNPVMWEDDPENQTYLAGMKNSDRKKKTVNFYINLCK